MDALFSQYLSEIVSFLGGVAGGALLTFTLTRNTVRGGGSVVDQSKSRAGGDIVGGNKTVNRD